MNTAQLSRLRITYAKNPALRYTGHLDLLRMWERTFRRSKLPLSYSQGFNQQPRMQMAAALPLGFTSQCEIIDIWLDKPESLDAVRQDLVRVLPPGIEILSINEIALKEPALQTRIFASDYIIILKEHTHLDTIRAAIQRLLTASTLPRLRRAKPYDLRPLIQKLELVTTPEGEIQLFIQLSHRESATGRPEEVLDEMAVPMEDIQVERVALHQN